MTTCVNGNNAIIRRKTFYLMLKIATILPIAVEKDERLTLALLYVV